jgi:hypothetical protein
MKMTDHIQIFEYQDFTNQACQCQYESR